MGKEDIIRSLRSFSARNLKVVVGDLNQVVTSIAQIDGVIVMELQDDPDPEGTSIEAENKADE